MKNKQAVFWVLISILLINIDLFGRYHFLGNVESVVQVKNNIILECGGPRLMISILASDLFRVQMTPGEEFPKFQSYAVIKKDWTDCFFQVQEWDSSIFINTEEIQIRIDKYPCRLQVFNVQGDFINGDYHPFGLGWDGERIKCWKIMDRDEGYYGLGEKTGGLNKRGRSWEMWNTDFPGYGYRKDPLYQTHPFFIGLKHGIAYGIFFDNTFRSEFQFGVGTNLFYTFESEGGEMDYYFFYGPSPKKVLSRYSELVGKMFMPPKWALGYQQCRYSYYPEAEVRRIAETFREKSFPCDVIYLDIHYMNEYRCFTWDLERFPKPKKLLDDLEKLGFKVVVIVDPGIKVDPGYWIHDQGLSGNHFCKYPDGKLYIGEVWPGECYFPDFTKDETRAWWGTLYKSFIEQGIDGFWNDMNEPGVWGGTFPDVVQHTHFGKNVNHRRIHNVYGMEMARSTYEGNLHLNPNKRPFVLTRAGYSGIQRYAAVWTGDNIGHWQHLEMALTMSLGMSISNIPFVGYDIGGFIGNPSPELFTRWLQLGIFSPLCRNHTEWGSADQEPWVYGDRYETINRKIIQQRYKLMPYIYNTFYFAYRTGIPIMRPMFLEYPDDEIAVNLNDQFLFGENLLIAPVIHEGTRLRKVYLPAGEWFNREKNELIRGPSWINVDAPLDVIPSFVKAGSIIPESPAVNFIEEKNPLPLTLNIYPGPKVFSDSLYEDTGDGWEFLNGHFCKTKYKITQENEGIDINISERQGSYDIGKRKVHLKIYGIRKKPVQVLWQDQPLENISDQLELDTVNTWKYDKMMAILDIHIIESGQGYSVRIMMKI